MIGSLISAGSNIAGTIVNANRANKSMRIQQRQFNQQYALAQEQLYRGAQIRRQDLDAAGLHPTLAAGNAGHTPLPSGNVQHRPNVDFDTSKIVEAALADSQIKKTKAEIDYINAQTTNVRSETEYRPKDYELRQQAHNLNVDEYTWVRAPMTALAQNRDEREQEMHDINKQFKNFEYQLLQLNVRGKKLENVYQAIDNSIRGFERDYINEHGAKMPTADVISETIRRHLGEFWHDYRLANIIADGSVETVTKILNYRLKARRQKNYDRLMY